MQRCYHCRGAVAQQDSLEDARWMTLHVCTACGRDQDCRPHAPTAEEAAAIEAEPKRIGHYGSKEDAVPYFGRAGKPSRARRADMAARLQQVTARAI